jgi:DNA-binding NarL/FixJ family response regulator
MARSTMTHPRTRVVIVDDELTFRRGLRAILEPFSNSIEIVREVACASDVADTVEELQPDLVLLDLRLPMEPLAHRDHRHGLEVIGQVKQALPKTHVLIMSNFRPGVDDAIVLEALNAGAEGYIAKDDDFDGEDLAKWIRQVVAGQAFYGPSIAAILFQGLRSAEAPLSQQEEVVLQSRARGFSFDEIATTMGVDESATGRLASSILKKARRYPIGIFRT